MRKLILIILILLLTPLYPGSAQSTKPMILPMADRPGPNTWLIGQFYGNTVDAFNYGREWYSAGQRLHFGMDFFAQCGTPVVAAADGEVFDVDNFNYGSDPHNVILRHPDLGVITLYGHLNEMSAILPGQLVEQGQVIGVVGDPDGVCASRPHLHFEIRSYDFRTLYNPVNYIEAPWHTLATIGPFTQPLFERDLTNPRRWLDVADQPDVQLGSAPLNNYTSSLPYNQTVRPPVNAIPARDLGELPLDAQWQFHPLRSDGCCAGAWWHPTDSNLLYLIDGYAGQPAQVYEIEGLGKALAVETAPPTLISPDGQYQIIRAGGEIRVRRTADQAEWTVMTEGSYPAISTGNSHLLWELSSWAFLPGEDYPTVETWISDLDGNNIRKIWSQLGGSAQWLDDHRVLIINPVLDRTDTTLTIYDVITDTVTTLGTWNWLRGISVAPGGGRLLFYLVGQPNPADNGIYTIETQPGAMAQKLPWFGGWRWRDANSIYYIPFNTAYGDTHLLAYYDFLSGELRYLTDPNTQPFTVANADWSVSPDGRRIVFTNSDGNSWVLELE